MASAGGGGTISYPISLEEEGLSSDSGWSSSQGGCFEPGWVVGEWVSAGAKGSKEGAI